MVRHQRSVRLLMHWCHHNSKFMRASMLSQLEIVWPCHNHAHGRMLAVALCQWEVLTGQQECRGGGGGGGGGVKMLP